MTLTIPKLPDWLAAIITYALDRATGRERAIGAQEANDAANAEMEKRIAAAIAGAGGVDAADADPGRLRDDDGFRRD